jgi:chromosome segregation ATPase
MTSHHKFSKIFSWVKDDNMNDSTASNVKRNSSVHNKPYPSQTLKRQDHPPAYTERPTTKANGAIIVKTSDFLPSNPQAELAVLKKRSHISLRSEETSTSLPMLCLGLSSDIASMSSVQNVDQTSNEKKEGLETKSEHLDSVEPEVHPTHLVSENQVLTRDLDLAKLQIKETQKRCDDAQSLADARQFEIEKLNATISTLRRLLAQANALNDEPRDIDANASEVDYNHDLLNQKTKILLDEIETQQKSYSDLLEKNQKLTKDYGKLTLQQVENNEIIKELQRENTAYHDDIRRYEVDKEHMQARLNNFLWEVNWVNK